MRLDGPGENHKVRINEDEVISAGPSNPVIARCGHSESLPRLPNMSDRKGIAMNHLLQPAHGLLTGTVIGYDDFVEVRRTTA